MLVEKGKQSPQKGTSESKDRKETDQQWSSSRALNAGTDIMCEEMWDVPLSNGKTVLKG